MDSIDQAMVFERLPLTAEGKQQLLYLISQKARDGEQIPDKPTFALIVETKQPPL